MCIRVVLIVLPVLQIFSARPPRATRPPLPHSPCSSPPPRSSARGERVRPGRPARDSKRSRSLVASSFSRGQPRLRVFTFALNSKGRPGRSFKTRRYVASPKQCFFQAPPISISAWLTASHPNSEVKQVRAGVVLRWGTTREGPVLRFLFHFATASSCVSFRGPVYRFVHIELCRSVTSKGFLRNSAVGTVHIHGGSSVGSSVQCRDTVVWG